MNNFGEKVSFIWNGAEALQAGQLGPFLKALGPMPDGVGSSVEMPRLLCSQASQTYC